ncbi:LOW QUALITY PROTEIN: 5-hydroxytryptamine receptor 3A-like [Lates calcarifer]|uniref:LOW QUALITY PROTEIN: 5-hydroxytryptamine receptor 3A-like n=2 Tax=Lates calcarifer TaxID=8187 RepID=A0AAJ8DVP3_LATCA|nr:LOW QUALITY PROTEIN: 5-hydroxytryptamine receptor 3A-like [Lates calcarifer]
MQTVFDRIPFRPAVNLSNPTITNISFTLYAVLGVYWQHEFLVWDPDECDGVTKISLPVKELWSPDIIVYEFVDDDVSQACPYVYVNHTGHIRWDRMLRLVSACNLEIFSFPFDVQNCTFTFGSYMHTIKDVRVSPALTFKEMSGNSKRYLEASGEWELVDILGETSILQFGIDEWDIITFWVVIKRRPVLYVVNLLIPSSFLMLIDILSFYLPPHSVDRASFKMTLILGYTVFLLIMNDLLPSTANGTPIIGIYFSVCLALMVISLLETVIITNVLHHNSMKYQEVPNWVRVVVLKHIATLICYRWPEEVQPPAGPQRDKPESSNDSSGPWIIQPASHTPSQHSTNNEGTQQIQYMTNTTFLLLLPDKAPHMGGEKSIAALPELQQICQYLGDLRAHLTSLQKESELQDQWCHVGYVLDFLLFRIYLLLISCYALVIISMWCIWISFVAALNCTSPTPESLMNALDNELFPKLLIRPVKSFSAPVNVSVAITVLGIAGVDEKSQILTTVLWQVLEWDIEELSWDEKECGTKRVSVPREKLWVPDIHIAQFMDEDKSPQTPYVYLYNTGHVYDDKPRRVVSSCQLGIYTFPFDVQNCSLTFGSYLHYAKDIKVFPGATPEDILQESREVLETNGEWELADVGLALSNLAFQEGKYSEVTFFLILRRRPLPYVVNLLIPSCFLITVDLFSFLLPPESVDRSSFKMTLILGYTVFLLIMNDLLPVTGESTPLINVFFSVSLALMVASLLETVFITNVQFRSSQHTAVPHWLSIFVLRYLAFVVCIPPMKKSNRVTVSFNRFTGDLDMNNDLSSISVRDVQSVFSGTPQEKPHPASPEPDLDELRKLSRDLTAIRIQIDKHFQGSKSAQEWQMIGIVIDRLLFSLYIIFISASFITIVGIWIWNNSYTV